MITKEMLERANRNIDTIKLKGKEYAMVKDRIKAFRQECPAGSIETELLSATDGTLIFRATIADEDGKVLATGHASETIGSSQVNSTSALENAETSAVGRALGLAGFGIDGSMASADEVANAIVQQNDKRAASDVERKTFQDLCALKKVEPTEILREIGWTGGRMTYEQYGKALAVLKEME